MNEILNNNTLREFLRISEKLYEVHVNIFAHPAIEDALEISVLKGCERYSEIIFLNCADNSAVHLLATVVNRLINCVLT